MTKLGIVLDYKKECFAWGGIEIPMLPMGYWTSSNIKNFRKKPEENYKIIKDAAYKQPDLNDVAAAQTHLKESQRSILLHILNKHKAIFKAKRGHWSGQDVEIELKADATPYHARAYRVPEAYKKPLRKEIERLEKEGVLKQVKQSMWASPTFAIPKKNDTIRVISDFRELNKRIKRKPYPIPNIRESVASVGQFKFATSIDLVMGFYGMQLSERSKQLCTIILPWGKWQYQSLPMGLASAPDIFQARMGQLFQDMEQVIVYMDDLLIIGTETFEKHIEQVNEVLTRLEAKQMQVNPDKSFWAKDEVAYLGFLINQQGIKPQPEKIEAMLNIKPPKNKKFLRQFIGMINYYKELFKSRSDILKPLTDMSGKNATFIWNEVANKAFIKAKAMIAKATMLAFPDFSKPFDLHTDASDYQIGSVLSQDDKPIAFFSRKLNAAQLNYTVTDKELLGITESLKHFRHILLGNVIRAHTDHKNLTYAGTNYNSDRRLRQRLLLEEYGVELIFVAGNINVVADGMSRLDFETCHKTKEECYHVTETEHAPPPFDLQQIAKEQEKCSQLLQLKVKGRDVKLKEVTDGLSLWHFKPRQGTTYQIYVPTNLQIPLVEWYHNALKHPGTSRTKETICQHYAWPNATTTINEVGKQNNWTAQLRPPSAHYHQTRQPLG